jgi:methylthioribose-1-phosphate isomerase
MTIIPMRWWDGCLLMLDQRVLPGREEWLSLTDHEQVAQAIRDMVVRGAPAIGVAAGYGMALAAKNGVDRDAAADLLAASRPTAVNLFWAIERIRAMSSFDFGKVLAEAKTIEAEDLEMNHAIGRHGAALIPENANVLTICNTGGLATAGHGTALGVIRSAHDAGKNVHVWSCETRPRQQGLRLTAYELTKENIPFHSIADGAAASLMRAGKVDCVIAGADRIAANGDSANKIGTYSLAVLARHHGIPFYIAAPSSTLDSTLPNGDVIPIEERGAEELTHIEGIAVGPEGCRVYNPAFDVTPGELIDAIITEEGVHRAPYSFLADHNLGAF